MVCRTKGHFRNLSLEDRRADWTGVNLAAVMAEEEPEDVDGLGLRKLVMCRENLNEALPPRG